MNNNAPAQTKPHQWQQLYQAITDFYQQQPEQNIHQQAEQLAQRLMGCAAGADYCVFAQLQLSPVQSPFSTLLAVKQSCLLYLLARQQQWPDKLCLQLISTALLSLIAVAGAVNKLPEAQRKDAKLLHFPGRYCLARYQQILPPYCRYWLQHGSATEQSKPDWQQNPFSTALQLTSLIARQLLLQPTAGLLHTLQRCYWRQSHSLTRMQLEVLVSIGPVLWHCGNLLQQQHQQWLVLDKQADLWLVLPLRQQQLQSSVHSIRDTSDQPIEIYGTELSDWSWLACIARSESSDLIQQAFTAKKTSTVLDFDQIVALCDLPQQQLLQQLEQDTAGSELILAAASKANRSQQSIQQLKHAFLLLGAEQLPWLLAQIQCQQFAVEQHQPCHQWLVQLRLVLQQALTEQPLALPTAQVDLISWLLTLPLWQLSTLRLLPGFDLGSCQQLRSQCQRQIWQSENYLKKIQWLFHHYQQPKALQQALLFFRSPSQAQSDLVRHLSQHLQTAWRRCDQLMLQSAPASTLTEQVSATLLHQCYYPIRLSM